MTKLQKRVKAHHVAKKRAKGRLAGKLMKLMNPGAKKIAAVRVKRLKGGGVSITPIGNPPRKGETRQQRLERLDFARAIGWRSRKAGRAIAKGKRR